MLDEDVIKGVFLDFFERELGWNAWEASVVLRYGWLVTACSRRVVWYTISFNG